MDRNEPTAPQQPTNFRKRKSPGLAHTEDKLPPRPPEDMKGGEGPITQAPAHTLQHILSFLEPQTLALAGMVSHSLRSRAREARVCWCAMIEWAAKHGYLQVLKVILPKPVRRPVKARDLLHLVRAEFITLWCTACSEAASGGHLECLKYLRRMGLPCDDARKAAAGAGAVDCLAFLIDGDRESALEDRSICEMAAARGQFRCLKLALSEGCPLGRSRKRALESGSLACLRLVYEVEKSLGTTDAIRSTKGPTSECLRWIHSKGIELDERVLINAARYGNRECLEYAHQAGAPWDEGSPATRSAVTGEHFDCLVYAHEHGCPWDERVSERALECLSSDFFEYLLENGCPVDEESVCERAAAYGATKCLVYAHARGCPLPENIVAEWVDKESCVGLSDPDCLRYLVENGCKWGRFECSFALGTPCEGLIPFLRDRGCPWGEKFAAQLCARGELDAVKYAHSQGIAIEQGVVERALNERKLVTVKYLHENGCIRDDGRLCSIAAAAGTLECLAYLHARGYRIGLDAASCAARGRSLECLEYVLGTGAAWDVDAFLPAAEYGTACVRMLHEKGRTWHPGVAMTAAVHGKYDCLRYALEVEGPCARPPGGAAPGRTTPEQIGRRAAAARASPHEFHTLEDIIEALVPVVQTNGNSAVHESMSLEGVPGWLYGHIRCFFLLKDAQKKARTEYTSLQRS